MAWIDDARMARTAVERDRELMERHSGQKPRAGALPCPICKTGTLSWMEAPNEHFHMECSDKSCISWAE